MIFNFNLASNLIVYKERANETAIHCLKILSKLYPEGGLTELLYCPFGKAQ